MNIPKWLPVLLLVALAAGQPAPVQVMPYDSLAADRVSVDGYVDREEQEYPGNFTDKATGISVSWSHDDSMMYVGLETRGKGWLGVSFGAGDTGFAFVGFYTDDSSDVYTMRTACGSQGIGVDGVPGYSAARPLDSDTVNWEAEIDRDDETGVMTLELACPLSFAASESGAVVSFVPGTTYNLVLAQNSKSVSLDAKATHKALAGFKLAAQK